MDPVVAQGFAAVLTAIATAILMFAAAHWGVDSRQRRRKRREDDDDRTED